MLFNVFHINTSEISEIDFAFTVQFRLHMEWFDPGLTFVNLKLAESANLNSLSAEQKEKIWLPSVTFSNTANKATTVRSILELASSNSYYLLFLVPSTDTK